MHIEQARKMRDGLLKGNSVMAQAWKELLGGIPSGEAPDGTDWEEIGKTEGTERERKALGIPTQDEPEESF